MPPDADFDSFKKARTTQQWTQCSKLNLLLLLLLFKIAHNTLILLRLFHFVPQASVLRGINSHLSDKILRGMCARVRVCESERRARPPVPHGFAWVKTISKLNGRISQIELPRKLIKSVLWSEEHIMTRIVVVERTRWALGVCDVGPIIHYWTIIFPELRFDHKSWYHLQTFYRFLEPRSSCRARGAPSYECESCFCIHAPEWPYDGRTESVLALPFALRR